MKPHAGKWREVRDVLDQEISSGILQKGMRLPTEPALCARFDVGRHSVRRAISALAAKGKIRADQGRGTFVKDDKPLQYTISQRTRFHVNIESQGRTPHIESLHADIIRADAEKAALLDIAPMDEVAFVRQRSFADDLAISLATSFHPAQRFPDLLKLHQDGATDSAIYHHHGVADYLRLETIISARIATEEEARLLNLVPNQPVIIMEKRDIDMHKKPIGYSVSVWPAEHIRFSLETMSQNEVHQK
ncbi:phosphonate metabolism transcriptional regulator PhnF [Bartonella sp. LJL80]